MCHTLWRVLIKTIGYSSMIPCVIGLCPSFRKGVGVEISVEAIIQFYVGCNPILQGFKLSEHAISCGMIDGEGNRRRPRRGYPHVRWIISFRSHAFCSPVAIMVEQSRVDADTFRVTSTSFCEHLLFVVPCLNWVRRKGC